MLFKNSKVPASQAAQASTEDNRWLLTDLEAAQRRNLYAAGFGDRPRSPRPWPSLFGKRR